MKRLLLGISTFLLILIIPLTACNQLPFSVNISRSTSTPVVKATAIPPIFGHDYQNMTSFEKLNWVETALEVMEGRGEYIGDKSASYYIFELDIAVGTNEPKILNESGYILLKHVINGGNIIQEQSTPLTQTKVDMPTSTSTSTASQTTPTHSPTEIQNTTIKPKKLYTGDASLLALNAEDIAYLAESGYKFSFNWYEKDTSTKVSIPHLDAISTFHVLLQQDRIVFGDTYSYQIINEVVVFESIEQAHQAYEASKAKINENVYDTQLGDESWTLQISGYYSYAPSSSEGYDITMRKNNILIYIKLPISCKLASLANVILNKVDQNLE